MNVPLKVQEFIDKKIILSDICLPQTYPEIKNFEEFQRGYRYNAISGENLTSEEYGQWNPNWYVIAINYFDDPYFINISENHLNFPVYYSQHGAGTWISTLVSETLDKFDKILCDLKEIETDNNQVCTYLTNSVNIQNKLWKEVLLNYKNIEDEGL